MVDCYRVKDWDVRFETAETRKLECLKWLPKPNKHDGLSFRRMAARKDCCDLYTAWMLILEIVSRSRRTERGMLVRDGRPLSPCDLAIMTGFPERIFDKALKFFSSEDIGWLIPPSPDNLPLLPADLPTAPAVLNGREGREEKDCGRKAVAFPNGMTDSEFLSVMAADPTYAGIDVPREHGKMAKWCSVNKKVPTRKRFVNWLNRADRPMNGTLAPAVKKRPRELPERFRSWLLEKYPDRREEISHWKTFSDLPNGCDWWEEFRRDKS